MSENELLSRIQARFEKNIALEGRIRKVLYGIIITFGVVSIGAFANTVVIQDNVKDQGEQIDVIRKNYVSYDNFFMFNRTYELQLEESQALLEGDIEKLEEVQAKYRELRAMIVTRPTTRGGN